jgi:hypothetical protein
MGNVLEGGSSHTWSTSSPTVKEVEGGKDTNNLSKKTLTDVLEADNDENRESKNPETINLDGLIDVVESRLPETGIMDIIRHSYEKDSFLRKIIEHPKDYRNFSVENKLIYLTESD